MAKPRTVDEYIEGFSGPGRELLERLRTLAREAVPKATEAIKWGHPAWVHPSGTILFMVSGHAKYVSVAFTPSTRAKFDAELADRDTGKSTIKLPQGRPAPVGAAEEDDRVPRTRTREGRRALDVTAPVPMDGLAPPTVTHAADHADLPHPVIDLGRPIDNKQSR
jgi:uncharacterized protein YdhG (YjbR/CyaY superfamily)